MTADSAPVGGLAKIDRQLEAERRRELTALPAKYGFKNVASFVAAVRQAGRRRKRARITDATRASVNRLVDAGKTGQEIARALNISPASVQTIKKALGLVKLPRGYHHAHLPPLTNDGMRVAPWYWRKRFGLG